VSLRASSAERLEAAEEERSVIVTRLSEAQHRAKKAQTAFNTFAREAARK
jgi:hypothetical protein